MDMPGVRSAGLEHIHPDVIQLQPFPSQVHLQLSGEGFDMRLHHPHELLETRRPLRQVVERGVGRVALIAMLLAPGAAGLVLLRQHLRGVQQISIQLADVGKRRAVEFGDEETVRCHKAQLPQPFANAASPLARGEAARAPA